MKRYLLILLLLSAGCGTPKEHPHSHSPQLDSIRQMWIAFHLKGAHDSLILKTAPLFRDALARRDSIITAHTGAQLAQSYLVLEKKDSVLHYLHTVAPYIDRLGDPNLGILFCNVYGGYYLKYAANYTLALKYLLEGYEYAKAGDSANGMIAMLSSIVNIFYIRSDRHGLDYALQAEKLLDRNDVEDLYKCYAHISLAQMYGLSGDFRKALDCVERADTIILRNDLTYLKSLLGQIEADIRWKTGEWEQADRCYDEALRHFPHADPDIRIRTLFKYGKFKWNTGYQEKAIRLCHKCLEISEHNGSHEFRRELLRTLAEFHDSRGASSAALDYYRHYMSYQDSTSNESIEHDFNNLHLDYLRLKHEHALQSEQLRLLRANRRVMLLCVLLGVVAILLLSLWMLLLRKRNMYRILAAQYQQYLHKYGERAGTDRSNAVFTEKHAAPGEELFRQIERLMKDEELYREKNISLDVLARKLESNRTYVSNAINTFAGMSFYSYVNACRIREAASILAGSDGHILLKQLADSLGFNSVTVFSRVFQSETGVPPSRYRSALRASK